MQSRRNFCFLLFFLFSVCALSPECYLSIFEHHYDCEGMQQQPQMSCEVSSVLLLGDSIIRNTFVQLLELYKVNAVSSNWDSYKGHRDFRYHLLPRPSLSNPKKLERNETAADFGSFDAKFNCPAPLDITTMWLPFIEDQKEYIKLVLAQQTDLPEVILFNFGLWDLLHNHDAVHYENSVKEYFHILNIWISNVQSTQEKVPKIFLLLNGILEPEKMFTEDKKQYMTPQASYSYTEIVNKQLKASGCARFIETFDLFELMKHAPSELTDDGIHPQKDIIDVLVQIFLSKINKEEEFVGGRKNSQNFLHSKEALADAPQSASFVGRYPVLGLFVGIYIFAVLASGDIFLITHLLMNFVK